MASPGCTRSLTRAKSPSLLPNQGEVGELLERICSDVSDATTAEIVDLANCEESQEKLRDLLPVYFYSWQVKSPEAIMIYLLLHCFILKRDGNELRQDKKDFEKHIERLKNRLGELEERCAENGSADGSAVEASRLATRIDELTRENVKLQQSRDEVRKMFFCK